MARQVVTSLVDDLDGSAAQETVAFSVDGKSYEIDLNGTNARRLRDIYAPFVAAARRPGARRRRQGGPSSSRPDSGRRRQDLAEIRAWLRDNGYPVAERGRVAAEHIQAWQDKRPASAASTAGRRGRVPQSLRPVAAPTTPPPA